MELPPLSAEARAKLIADMVEEIGTAEGFQQRLKDQLGEAGFDAFSKELGVARVKLMFQGFKRANDRLLDYKFWQSVAPDRKAFNAELNKALATMRKAMQIVYGVGVASRRPRKNDERDQKIYEKRKQGRSFGEIGIELKISDRTAERAFKRYEQTHKEALRSAIEFFLDLAYWQQEHASAPKADAATDTTT